MFDVAIIGCGVIGAATAYTLARYQLKVLVLEAENDVADGTTKANSAIIHAGYDPEPGTRMARLDVLGNRLAGEICERLDVPFKRNGSLVLAFDENDRRTIEKLYQQGKENGVPGLELLEGDAVRRMEPTLPGSWTPSRARYRRPVRAGGPWRSGMRARNRAPWGACMGLTEAIRSSGTSTSRTAAGRSGSAVPAVYTTAVRAAPQRAASASSFTPSPRNSPVSRR